MPASPIFQPMLRTSQILWAGLTVSTLVLSVLIVTMPTNTGHVAPPDFGPIFVVVALVTAGASFFVPARATAAALGRTKEQQLIPGPTDPATGRPTVTFADPATAARSAFGLAFQPLLLSIALSESVTLDGFALHMVGGPTVCALPIGLFGVVLAALRFPTVTRMVGPYEKAYGATFGEAERG
jgi:hypothetical protein